MERESEEDDYVTALWKQESKAFALLCCLGQVEDSQDADMLFRSEQLASQNDGER